MTPAGTSNELDVQNEWEENTHTHTHTHRYHTLSTPTSYQKWVWEREAHFNWSMVTCQSSTRYWNYLEVYWPCAGGLSAVNAIGTQLRDPINLGLNPYSQNNWNLSPACIPIPPLWPLESEDSNLRSPYQKRAPYQLH